MAVARAVAAALAAFAAVQTPTQAAEPSAMSEAAADGLQPWPYPPPAAAGWWTDRWPAAPEARDPLAGRPADRWGAPTPVANGVDPLLYRLWGLTPLQAQLLDPREAILEVWVRPARTVRQAVVRVVLRRDGKAFVSARAGLACCEPDIARRVDVDAELSAEARERLRAVAEDPLWSAPARVRVVEDADAADAICVDGAAYDLTRLQRGSAVSVRRACADAEVGQAAAVLDAVLGAARGLDPRLDAALPDAAEFRRARDAYEALVAGGGALKPARP